MLVRIWGCRGSVATPGRETLRYGGNTSCVEVVCRDGTQIVLDAGTGIRALGLELAREPPQTIHLCLTHLHLDHVEGLGFFAPIFRPETELHVWGPPRFARTIQQRLAHYLSAPLFPLELIEIPATLVFHDVPSRPWEIGGARIAAAHVSHPGTTVGYRVEADGAALAYLPDHEPALGVGLETLTPDWISGFSIAEDADVLMHDAQYTEDQYRARIGWGHSSVGQAVAFARISQAEQLLLFHHDPLHSDADLAALQATARELWRDGGAPPELAYEGMEIRL